MKQKFLCGSHGLTPWVGIKYSFSFYRFDLIMKETAWGYARQNAMMLVNVRVCLMHMNPKNELKQRLVRIVLTFWSARQLQLTQRAWTKPELHDSISAVQLFC